MLKVGQKVAPILRMSSTGIILEIARVAINVEMVGGTLSSLLMARVKMDADDSILEFKVSDLMRID